MEVTEVGHPFPVWGAEADYLLIANVEEDNSLVREQLWAKQLDGSSFKICCIPGFAKDIALGDIVESDSSNVIVRIVKHSGRWVFRAWSDSGWEDKFEVLHSLNELGALMETCTFSLLGIDAADEASASAIREYLEEMERQEVLYFETGWT